MTRLAATGFTFDTPIPPTERLSSEPGSFVIERQLRAIIPFIFKSPP